MTNNVSDISLLNLSIAFIPIVPVLFVLYRWRLSYTNVIYALSRMLAQLLVVGYFLAFIFETEKMWIVLIVLSVMVFAASWIALGPVASQRTNLYKNALAAIVGGGITTLIIISQGVLMLDPWYLPQYMVPLAGMIFANSMNAVSLAAERLSSELKNGLSYMEARAIALQSSLIPITNSLFAVGLVSLPGMMTGQILSGVSPLIAARYQIVVMCMIFGSAGISAALFLVLSKKKFSEVVQS